MKDLFGATVSFKLDFHEDDTVSPSHDTETCDCCGNEKTAFTYIPFNSYVTNDGKVPTEEGDNQSFSVDSVWTADGAVYDDRVEVIIPHLSLPTVEDESEAISRRLLTLTENVLRQIERSQDLEFDIDVAGMDDGSIDYTVDDTTFGVDSVGITHPMVPTHSKLCDDHGIEFLQLYADEELEACCDNATITYEMEDLSKVDAINEAIQQHLRNAVKDEHTMVNNPYDESGIIPTGSLVPFLHKHGADGVTVWNALNEYLFARNGEMSYHPTLDAPEDVVTAIDDGDISDVEYLQIAVDLFETLRWECPIVETDDQTQALRDQFPELYQPRVSNESAWTTVTPIWENVLERDETKGISDNRNLYDSYRDAYSGGKTYQYDEEEFVDALEKDYVILPATVFGREYKSRLKNIDGVYFMCQVNRTGYVPDINEHHLGDANPILPTAAWMRPHFAVLRDDAEVSLSQLQSLASDMRDVELESRPVTDSALESMRQVVGEIPTGPQETDTLRQFIFDQDELDDAPQKTTLGSYIDSIGDVLPPEQRDNIVKPYEGSTVATELDGNYWQTGLAVAEFPIVHGTDTDHVLEQDDHFIDFSVNIHSPDDSNRDSVSYSYHPRVNWDAMLPEDFDATEEDNAKAAIREHVDNSDYDTDATLYMFRLSGPVITEHEIETTDIDRE